MHIVTNYKVKEIMDFFKNLSEEDTQKYIELAIEYGTNLLGALAVFVIGRWVARFLVNRVLKKALNKSKADATLVAFLSNITYAALLVFVVISALGTLGVNTTSFAAVIAAAGLAIGLALQGSLSNFAAGFMIIIFKWFKKGDFVEIGGVSGSVLEVSIFTTKLKTRPWVKTEDYWEVLWDTHEAVKIEFDKAGISIPFPQRDIHHYHVGVDSTKDISIGKKTSTKKKK